MIGLKSCSRCLQTKPLTEFNISRKTRNGYRFECRACQAQYYLDNRLARDTYMAKWRILHREQWNRLGRQSRARRMEKHLAYNKQWRDANPERMQQARDNWKKLNRERIALTHQQWRSSNKDKERSYKHKRRSGNGDFVSAGEIQTQLEKQSSRCYWCCNILSVYHVDHILPLSKGGTNTTENICIACPTCNLKKGVKLPTDFVLAMLSPTPQVRRAQTVNLK